MDLSRRTLLLGGLTAAGAGVLSACSGKPAATAGLVLPSQSALTPKAGQNVVTKTLIARPTTLDLGGPTVNTWAYGDTLPGPVVRATAGDLLRITLDNQLPADSTIHWHGIALRNAADGVPGLTQNPVSAGSNFVYEFVASDPGTYFYHPHVGVQLDRGLYAPLIIDDPNDPGDYDAEWIVVLDDWLDGTGTTPDDVLTKLTGSASSLPSSSASDGMSDMGGMDMGGDSSSGGMDMSGMGGMSMGTSNTPFGDAGDVTYPYFLVNGRVNTAPDVFTGKPGQRIRVRVINAAADTIFSVAVGEHRLTLTHTDGYAVQPQAASAFYIGMGERYDLTLTLKDGVFPLVAKPVGKDGVALGLIRTAAGTPPTADQAAGIAELSGQVLVGSDLLPAESSRLPVKDIGQSVTLSLSGQMSPYAWAINGAPYGKNKSVTIESGKRVSVQLNNMTMMTHPMHLHGHTFALPSGLRKDTVLLKPMQNMAVQLEADNPGNWMAHCHNIYHAEAGMMAALVYDNAS
ncbi:multicopper oxidase family protein [Nocardioides fonticola]|uniref:Multicopper oxidase family protein n=1 Tax=Nocardioides fonticola TaxID=450363 RepID=A0ABP7XXE6_9ACTN